MKEQEFWDQAMLLALTRNDVEVAAQIADRALAERLKRIVENDQKAARAMADFLMQRAQASK